MGEPGWTVVLAVKRLDVAKSRLRGAVDGVPHDRLALALALDTVAAVLACRMVREAVVVTDDGAAAAAVREVGARVVPDRPGAGLNPAFAHGAALAGTCWRAALAADLPALRPADLAAALWAAAERAPVASTAPVGPAGRSFVADAPGSGTVLLAAAPGVPLDPRFGPDSAAAHLASGARPLVGGWPTLRRDVDTAADLAAAARLGLGTHTSELIGNRRTRSRRASAGTVQGMQGTVATFDGRTRTGTLLLDDGTELAFPAPAFDTSGLRLLRLGQRVRIDTDPSGTVVRITLPTFD